MMVAYKLLFLLAWSNLKVQNVSGFLSRHGESSCSPSWLHTVYSVSPTTATVTSLAASLSSLPQAISPFEISLAKRLDIQGSFRKLAVPAINQAVKDGVNLIEVEFPPLMGGDKSKTNFDDFDNIQELNANRDWCVETAPDIAGASKNSPVWLILPDDKEVELAVQKWTGQRYKKATKFTSIRAAVQAVGGEGALTKAWGSTLASTLNKLAGGDGILADSSALDNLDYDSSSTGRFHFVCQPGNGGPVEDWINVEKLHSFDSSQVTCIVNGALDKVRGGYYPPVFFPALAKTMPFYEQFETAFYLKPISDKGQYGWLYRVYPEPWQVILQTAQQKKRGKETMMTVENTVVLVAEQRPSYQQAVDVLCRAASDNS